MKAILSIKPYYANKILNWEKLYELRKSIFKLEVDKVFIYASAPISKIIWEFCVDWILCDNLEDLREKTKDYSCVDKNFFNTYFKNKNKWYAIRIWKVKKYNTQLNIREDFWMVAPQSFSYVY